MTYLNLNNKKHSTIQDDSPGSDDDQLDKKHDPNNEQLNDYYVPKYRPKRNSF